MNSERQSLMTTPLTWMTALSGIALIAFAFAPFASEYPLAVVGILAFLAVPVLLPECRLNAQAPLCPGNVAQIFFWWQLVLVPLTIGYFGVALGTLPYVPSTRAMNAAIGLRIVAYIAFCVAYQWARSRECDVAPSEEPQDGLSNWFLVAFLGIGAIGWLLHYDGVAGFLEYASSPLVHREREQEATTITNAAGSFLRHFLGFAIVWAWSIWLFRTGAVRRLWLAIPGTLVVIALLVAANFSYNRGTLLAPMLALAAAFSMHVRRISFTLGAVAGTIVLVGALTVGWYRSTALQISDLAVENVDASLDERELVDFAQIYGAGPQLTAFLINQMEMDRLSYHGSTLLPSVVYPIPVLGKGYRERSGVYIFNEMIYGDPTVVDQNLAYDAELFMNFHVYGVVIGYFLLGCLQAFLQGRFMATAKPIETYLWLFLSVWTVFPGSLPVLSQLCIYTFWPIYGYLSLKQLFQTPSVESGVVAKGWVTP